MTCGLGPAPSSRTAWGAGPGTASAPPADRGGATGMSRQQDIFQAICRAVDDVNPALPPARRLEKSPDVVLTQHLDSMGMVNFVVATEERVAESLGVTVNLADQQAMTQAESPLKTIGTLARYIEQRLEERG